MQCLTAVLSARGASVAVKDSKIVRLSVQVELRHVCVLLGSPPPLHATACVREHTVAAAVVDLSPVGLREVGAHDHHRCSNAPVAG